MPRSQQQFEEMRNATKEKIHAAATRLFVRKGFGSTSVQEIADAAGISIGLLYRHYKTKEELFNAIAGEAFAGLRSIAELFRSDGSPKALFDAFVTVIHDDLSRGEDLAHLLILMKQAALTDAANHEHGSIAEENTEVFRATADLIKRGQALGEFRPGDPYEMTVFFFSAIQGLADMKVVLQEDFAMPAQSILTAFLYRE